MLEFFSEAAANLARAKKTHQKKNSKFISKTIERKNASAVSSESGPGSDLFGSGQIRSD